MNGKELLYHRLEYLDGELIEVPIFGVRMPLEGFEGEDRSMIEPIDFQKDNPDGSMKFD